MKQRWFLIWCAVILIGGFGLQVAFIEKTPWDWDEPVYTVIAQQTQILGYPSSPINATSGEPGWYPYHPPFHFYLLANWFDLVGHNDINTGRVLSIIVSTLLRAEMMLFVWILSRQRALVLLVGLLASTDGWLLYTTSLVKLDTTAVLIGTTGMLFYLISLQRDSRRWAILAGFVIGLAVIYKHVSLIFVLAIGLHWVLTRRHRYHALVIGIAFSVLVIYIIGMAITVRDPYLNASWVQIKRTLGLQEARGLNYGLDVAVKALVDTYWAFGGTVFSMVNAVLAELWLVWTAVRKRILDQGMTVVVPWTLAAMVFLAIVRLRNPHYLIFLIVPAQILLALQLHSWMLNSKRWVRRGAWALLGLILVLNLRTVAIRYFDFSATNAFQQVQQVMAELPLEWVVLSEEPVCAFAREGQTCLKIGSFESAESLARVQPDVIILYSTTTHAPPSSPALVDLINRAVPLPGVTPVQGWKERFTFLLVDHDPEFRTLQ